MIFVVDDHDDNVDLDGVGAIGVIVLPHLDPRTKFNIISTIIQLLNSKGLFGGSSGDDPKNTFGQLINI